MADNLIAQNEIHLWFARDESIVDQPLLEYYDSLLNEEEKKQQQRFYFDKHRQQFLVTRALVRTVLSLYVPKKKPSDWLFDRTTFGKPFITGPFGAMLHFNISHTENMIVMAVASKPYLGVDIESMMRSCHFLELAEHYFAPQEIKALKSLLPEQQGAFFYSLWTLKEAFIKAKGLGLKIPLNQFAFQLDQGISFSLNASLQETAGDWQFWQLQADDYLIALACGHLNSSVGTHLVMREIAPGGSIEKVDYPVIRKTSC